MDTERRWVHPGVVQNEVWPGEEGYPWKDTGINLWTREGILRRIAPGRLICTWTTGGFAEPSDGNFTMATFSDDNGKSWSEPRIWFRHAHRGLFTTELFVPRDGEVHAFLQTYKLGVWLTQLHSYRSISTDGGRTWSSPHSIPGGIQNVWPNQGIVHSSGRWILSASWAEQIGPEWCEPTSGRSPAEPIVGGEKAPIVELPYESDSRLIYRNAVDWAHRNHRYVVGALISDDEGKSFRLCGNLCHESPRHFVEPKIVELSDGRIVMLVREWFDGWLWKSCSHDGGQTWSPLERTDIPNPSSKVKILRSSDGRVFLLHNPSRGKDGQRGRRNPLSLWVSSDEMQTWERKVDLVRDDESSLNYPDGYIDEEEGVIHFAWEDGRRVYLMKVPLDIESAD